MSVAIPIPLLQNLPDVNVTPAVGVDEYALTYDNDTGKFVLRQVAGVINAMAYGASPGATAAANTAAIQAAVNACIAAGGGCVVVPSGNYALSDQINLSSNVWLRGSGRDATTLFQANGTNKNVISAIGTAVSPLTSIKVSDLTIDGNKANNDGNKPNGVYIALELVDKNWNGIRFKYVNDSTIENICSKNHSANGIQLEYSAFVKIVNNVLEGNVFDGLYLTNESNGNHVSGNTVRNNTDFGISLEKTTYPGEPTPNSAANWNTIANNQVYSNSSTTLGWVTTYGAGISLLNGASFNVIQGNEISTNVFDGVYINANSNSNRVADNYISGNGQCGVRIIANSLRNSVTNNTVANNGTAANETYDNIYALADQTIINGNSVYWTLGSNKPRYGINVDTSIYCMIANNWTAGHATSEINSLSITNAFGTNYGSMQPVVPTLTNSWVNMALGFANCGYCKVGGQVFMQGMMKSGTPGTSIFTLHVTCRPPATLLIPSISAASGVIKPTLITINTDGTVVPDATAGTDWVLINLSFITG